MESLRRLGIKVCDEWVNDFDSFYAYIGPKPGASSTLDRIDLNGNYEPGNVRWATKKEQARNTRRTIWVRLTEGESKGQVVPLADAAEVQGISRSTALSRMKRECGLERGSSRSLELITSPVSRRPAPPVGSQQSEAAAVLWSPE